MRNEFEKAKAAYGTGAYDDATLEFLFPELKEPQGDKILQTIDNTNPNSMLARNLQSLYNDLKKL